MSKQISRYAVLWWEWVNDDLSFEPRREDFRYEIEAERKYNELEISLDIPQVALMEYIWQYGELIEMRRVAFKENYNE